MPTGSGTVSRQLLLNKFFDQNFFFRPKFFCEPTFFLDLHFFSDQHFFRTNNFFLDQQLFFNLNSFLKLIYFWGKKCLGHKHQGQKTFWEFLEQDYFHEPNIFWRTKLLGPKKFLRSFQAEHFRLKSCCFKF